MNLLYGDALAEVFQRVMKSLFGIDAKLVERRSEEGKEAPFEVSGIIGLTGPTKGSIVLSFPLVFARQLTAWMIRERHPQRCTSQEISDCIGEIANIVAGNLLVLLEPQIANQTHISLPSVVMGSHRVVWSSRDVPCDLLLFETERGLLAAETNLREVLRAP